MSQSLGDRIIETRTKRGINQSQLAGLLGVSSTAVWNWEQNGITPRPAMLANVAKALGVSTSYLMTGDEVAQSRTAAQIMKAAAEEVAALNGVPVSRVHISWRIDSEPADSGG